VRTGHLVGRTGETTDGNEPAADGAVTGGVAVSDVRPGVAPFPAGPAAAGAGTVVPCSLILLAFDAQPATKTAASTIALSVVLLISIYNGRGRRALRRGLDAMPAAVDVEAATA
jgi:hypothetical protein